jgi:DNA-binding GntR family transcriptional regulator
MTELRSHSGERRQPASEVVAGAIRDRILKGVIEPGARLTEERLSQELEVGRGPIREALRRLADEGVIVLVPNRGATVRTVTRRWLMELFEIREVIEGYAARRAAESLSSPDDIRWFQSQVQIWNEFAIAGDRMRFFEENIRFHHGFSERCGNSRLAEFMPKFRTPVPLHLHRFMDQHDDERRRASAIDHRQIAEAILTHDGTGAETLARYHIRRTAMLLHAIPDSAFSE